MLKNDEENTVPYRRKSSAPRSNISAPVYNNIPSGWAEIKGASTAPIGYIWISNNKSYFSGERKQALLKNN